MSVAGQYTKMFINNLIKVPFNLITLYFLFFYFAIRSRSSHDKINSFSRRGFTASTKKKILFLINKWFAIFIVLIASKEWYLLIYQARVFTSKNPPSSFYLYLFHQFVEDSCENSNSIQTLVLFSFPKTKQLKKKKVSTLQEGYGTMSNYQPNVLFHSTGVFLTRIKTMFNMRLLINAY